MYNYGYLVYGIGDSRMWGSNSGNDAKSATQATVQENKDEAKMCIKS